MARKNVKINDAYDFIQYVLTPGMVRFLLALEEGAQTYQELKERHVTYPKKVIRFLGLTARTIDDVGIVRYNLTKKGAKLAVHLRNLYECVNDILPDEE